MENSIKSLIECSEVALELKKIALNVASGGRISPSEALELYNCNELGLLGMLAFEIKKQKSGLKVFYNRNFHIEPTNVCINNCKFCSYSRKKGENGAWEMSMDEIIHKVSQYKGSRATECHIVGGVHPERDIEYYGQLIKNVKNIMPELVVKAFTAVEIEYMAQKAGLSIEGALLYLKKCGLQSIPGGGAEILDEEVRKKICPEKTTATKWLEIHQTAHKLGITTNATMLYGHVESYSDRVEHLSKLRQLQDKTGGFSAFIPLKYRKENNQLNLVGEVSLVEDLKNYAVSRIFLDNFPHIKAYWVMSGQETTRLALQFGADDIDGTVNDSTKIYSMAGAEKKPIMTVEQIQNLVRSAGLVPVERDTFYNEIK